MSTHSYARVLSATIILFASVTFVALASATPVVAQSTDPGGGGGEGLCVNGLCFGGAAGTWLQDTINHIVSDFLSGLAKDLGDAIVGFIGDVNFLTHTPENLSYNDELVKQFATVTQVLADGLLAVVVLVGGYNVMLRPYLAPHHMNASGATTPSDKM